MTKRGGENVHDHLFASEESIADEFAGAEGDGGVAVGHVGRSLSGWMCQMDTLCQLLEVYDMLTSSVMRVKEVDGERIRS